MNSDFVIEAKTGLFVCEPKHAAQMQNPEALAKRAAADHAKEHSGKTWQHFLIPHDAIAAT